MSASSAYLLISHGSRDWRSQAAITQLAQLVATKLSISNPTSLLPAKSHTTSGRTATLMPSLQEQEVPAIGTATLECASLPLHQQVIQFAQDCPPEVTHLELVPLFLLPGVHVMEDIPEQIALAQRELGTQFTLHLHPHIGAHSALPQLVAQRQPQVAAEARILLSHGSRRPAANQPVETLATQLGATPAYWSVSPSLEHVVQALGDRGYQSLAIMSYFLFSGRITDAIEQTVNLLSQQFPHLSLTLLPPLEASPELADLIVNLLHQKSA